MRGFALAPEARSVAGRVCALPVRALAPKPVGGESAKPERLSQPPTIGPSGPNRWEAIEAEKDDGGTGAGEGIRTPDTQHGKLVLFR